MRNELLAPPAPPPPTADLRNRVRASQRRRKRHKAKENYDAILQHDLLDLAHGVLWDQRHNHRPGTRRGSNRRRNLYASKLAAWSNPPALITTPTLLATPTLPAARSLHEHVQCEVSAK